MSKRGRIDQMVPWAPGHVVTNDDGIMVPISVIKTRLSRVSFVYHRYLDACNTVDCAIRQMLREVEDK